MDQRGDEFQKTSEIKVSFFALIQISFHFSRFRFINSQ